MRIIKTIVIVTLLAIAGVVAWLCSGDRLSVDSCLDRGGCWNYDEKVCIFPRDNTKAEIDRAQLRCEKSD